MFRKSVTLFILVLFINISVCPYGFAREVLLENGTRIRLKLVDKVSSSLNNEGDQVNFTVVEDVKMTDTTLIKEGTRVNAIISELIPRSSIGRAGKLNIDLIDTTAVDGKTVPLAGIIVRKGQEKTLLSAILAACTAPIGLLFLTMKGTDAQLPAGYQYNARVDRDVILSIDNNIVPAANIKK